VANKAAIITGAGSGIGRATAVELSKLGCAITLVGRRRSELEETAALCSQSLVLDADITDKGKCARVVSSAVERFGRLDALIHCAGFAPVVRIDEITGEVWRQIVDTNLSAAIYLASAAWGAFRNKRAGSSSISHRNQPAIRSSDLALTARPRRD
jgi:NAD(P)-dependent dehydrogenase (short-subunit alcohol dehydrogenase family)